VANEPFDPPAAFQFPAALYGPAPREIVAEVKKSSYVRRRRQTLINLAVVGLVCVGYSSTPVAKTLAWYLLPFEFLAYIGFAIFAGAAATAVWRMRNIGLLKYIRYGTPDVARICDVRKVRTVTNRVEQFRFEIDANYWDSETGQFVYGTFHTTEQDTQRNAHRYVLDLKPGEYTTVVQMPSAPPALYGTMGIDPAHELICKDGKPPAAISHLAALRSTGIGVVIVLIPIAAFWAMLYCAPVGNRIQDPTLISGFAGAALGVVAGLVFWAKRRLTATLGQAVVGVGGFAMIAAFSGAMLAIVSNAVFDQSASAYRTVGVANYWVTTYKGVFRAYEFECRNLSNGPTGRTEKHPILPELMERLAATRVAIIETKNGWLGMPWIRAVYPVELREIEPGQTHSGRTVKMDIPQPDGSMRSVSIGFEAIGPDGKPLPLSTEAEDEAVRIMATHKPQTFGVGP